MKKEPKKNNKVQTEDRYNDGQRKKRPKSTSKEKYKNLKKLYVEGDLSEDEEFE